MQIAIIGYMKHSRVKPRKQLLSSMRDTLIEGATSLRDSVVARMSTGHTVLGNHQVPYGRRSGSGSVCSTESAAEAQVRLSESMLPRMSNMEDIDDDTASQSSLWDPAGDNERMGTGAEGMSQVQETAALRVDLKEAEKKVRRLANMAGLSDLAAAEAMESLAAKRAVMEKAAAEMSIANLMADVAVAAAQKQQEALAQATADTAERLQALEELSKRQSLSDVKATPLDHDGREAAGRASTVHTASLETEAGELLRNTSSPGGGDVVLVEESIPAVRVPAASVPRDIPGLQGEEETLLLNQSPVGSELSATVPRLKFPSIAQEKDDDDFAPLNRRAGSGDRTARRAAPVRPGAKSAEQKARRGGLDTTSEEIPSITASNGSRIEHRHAALEH